MKTETVVLIGIGVAAVGAGVVYYAKQKKAANAPQNPLAAPTNGNTNNRSAPAPTQTNEVQSDITAAAGAVDSLSKIGASYFGW